jgi:hypothetical protein
MRRLPALCASAAALAALPATAHAAAPQYLTEAACLGIYEAGFMIFSRLEDAGPSAGAGILIAEAVNGAAKMSYEQTIDAVIARDDMDDIELADFRDTHMASSEVVLAGYGAGEFDLFETGRMIYDCDVALGYAAEADVEAE